MLWTEHRLPEAWCLAHECHLAHCKVEELGMLGIWAERRHQRTGRSLSHLVDGERNVRLCKMVEEQQDAYCRGPAIGTLE